MADKCLPFGLCKGIARPLKNDGNYQRSREPGIHWSYSPPWVSDHDMRHGTCVTHVSWCMPGSLTSGFLWSRWRRKRSRHFWRIGNPQFYVSGKRPMTATNKGYTKSHLTTDAIKHCFLFNLTQKKLSKGNCCKIFIYIYICINTLINSWNSSWKYCPNMAKQYLQNKSSL